MKQDNLIKTFIALRVMDDPVAMRAARVALGTASFSERWRHFWGLPPTKEEVELAEQSRKLHEQIREMELKYGHRTEPDQTTR